MKQPQLWSPTVPSLYRAEVLLVDRWRRGRRIVPLRWLAQGGDRAVRGLRVNCEVIKV